MNIRTTEPVAAQGTREGESSLCFMRKGACPQPARLVRGSSRRIMTMRFRPANIRVINRRVSSSPPPALLSEPPVLKAHQQERVPAPPPVEVFRPCRNGARRQGFASPRQKQARPCPLRAVPAKPTLRRAAPAGTLRAGRQKREEKKEACVPPDGGPQARCSGGSLKPHVRT
jgi:hypothetical protein